MRDELSGTIVQFPAQSLSFLHHTIHGQDVLLSGHYLSLEFPEHRKHGLRKDIGQQ
jgi:hypothetical protein